jgi:hypothetical protein
MVVISGMLLFIYTSPRLLPISTYPIYIYLDSIEKTYLMRFVDHIPKTPIINFGFLLAMCADRNYYSLYPPLFHLHTWQICCVKQHLNSPLFFKVICVDRGRTSSDSGHMNLFAMSSKFFLDLFFKTKNIS